jgi:hypothetical protein
MSIDAATAGRTFRSAGAHEQPTTGFGQPERSVVDPDSAERLNQLLDRIPAGAVWAVILSRSQRQVRPSSGRSSQHPPPRTGRTLWIWRAAGCLSWASGKVTVRIIRTEPSENNMDRQFAIGAGASRETDP